eukprot:CAMPEP_0185167506 /NCGR_PEP_ID=MMETSP1139-20130426/14377_1 /TAXON_ID=298111 /ORGANISM="Pavlova sp., Strain CCMP459" /LENGTH=272 /DNA_ID=CAMNT_0027732989 /DNA_START=14 /DNA_END=832 /DNA_ORIENTATION=-
MAASRIVHSTCFVALATASLTTASAAVRGPKQLVLSSGFLCFSSHLGVLRCLQAHGELDTVRAIVGTSSGAIVGSMLAAGLDVDQITEVVTSQRPIALCKPSLTPWRGFFSASRLRRTLAEVLPDSFDDLNIPFAAGVARVCPGESSLEPVLVSSGSVVDAVLASCAVPKMFPSVTLADGERYVDGGVVDRTALGGSHAWRVAAAPGASTLVHLISDSDDAEFGPRDGIVAPEAIHIVRTSRTKQGLLSRFGTAFEEEVAEAERRCSADLAM